MNNQEILGVDSAYEHAKQCAHGVNMSISAALVIDMAERIAELENQWISVEDRLPEFHIQILFYAGNIDGLLKGAFYRHSHRFQDNGGNFFYKSDVTHWMPLPNKPKEQGE